MITEQERRQVEFEGHFVAFMTKPHIPSNFNKFKNKIMQSTLTYAHSEIVGSIREGGGRGVIVFFTVLCGRILRAAAQGYAKGEGRRGGDVAL